MDRFTAPYYDSPIDERKMQESYLRPDYSVREHLYDMKKEKFKTETRQDLGMLEEEKVPEKEITKWMTPAAYYKKWGVWKEQTEINEIYMEDERKQDCRVKQRHLSQAIDFLREEKRRGDLDKERDALLMKKA
jgi:hypothetical protein